MILPRRTDLRGAAASRESFEPTPFMLSSMLDKPGDVH
jgi:hypothetical protein